MRSITGIPSLPVPGDSGQRSTLMNRNGYTTHTLNVPTNQSYSSSGGFTIVTPGGINGDSVQYNPTESHQSVVSSSHNAKINSRTINSSTRLMNGQSVTSVVTAAKADTAQHNRHTVDTATSDTRPVNGRSLTSVATVTNDDTARYNQDLQITKDGVLERPRDRSQSWNRSAPLADGAYLQGLGMQWTNRGTSVRPVF